MWTISASFERDGQIIGCNQAEVLGEAYGKEYASREEAEAVAAEMQSEVGEYDLDPSTTYSVDGDDRIRCQCGEAEHTHRCDAMMLPSEAVVVEYMPLQHRSSHVAAGNSGVWPHNGSTRLQVAPGHESEVLEMGEGEWSWVVS